MDIIGANIPVNTLFSLFQKQFLWYPEKANLNNSARKDDNMNLKLIALDIDGTLTDDHKKITPNTRDTLLEIQEKGVRLVLASARPTPGLYETAEVMRLEKHQGILMAYNGGKIVQASNGEILSEIHMDEEKTRELLRFLETLPVTVILDDGAQFYVTDEQGYKVEYECKNNHMECTKVGNLADFLHFSPIKLLLSVDPSNIFEIQNTIAAHLDDNLIVVRTAPFYLEIIPAEINKGKGLSDICTHMGIDLADTAAFGDSENDIPMLQAAALGIAMGNAETAVKNAADRITLSNNEDGIAYAIHTWLTTDASKQQLP